MNMTKSTPHKDGEKQMWQAAFVSPSLWVLFKNTFLRTPFLWEWVIQDTDFDMILTNSHDEGRGHFGYLQRGLRKLFWFWPRITDALVWVEEKSDPKNFRHMSEGSKILVKEVAEKAQSKDSAILDLGCNCGRHMAGLADIGFTNLSGVDVNKRAIDTMFEWYPQLDGVGAAKVDFFQRFLKQAPDGAYDVVFSRGATIELIHPSFPLVEELVRVTQNYVVLLIQEKAHAYPRFWIYEFARNGFDLVKLIRPIGQEFENKSTMDDLGNSLLVFRRNDG